MFDDLDDLYQQVILDHNKNPHHFGLMENASHRAHGHNPLCGDSLVLFLKIQDGTIVDVSFKGEGCAIFKASASMMTDAVMGKTLEEVQTLFKAFHQMVAEEGDADKSILGKVAVFAGVKEFPARVKCASLAWHTLTAALAGKDDTSTE